jgi:hypothetical protein
VLLVKSILALAVAAFAATAFALGAAASPTAAPVRCPNKVTAGGKIWLVVVTVGFRCATARTVVRTLAPRIAPRPVGRYAGRYAGVVCVGRPPGRKPQLIICGNPATGRGFTAAGG